MPLLDYSLYAAQLRFIIYNRDLCEHRSGESIILNLAPEDFNSALLLLFDRGINTEN